MSRANKFHKPDAAYFVSFAVVEWIDVFTRRSYKDILVESLKYCQENKGLQLHAWVIMSNHVHLAISSDGTEKLSSIMRDMKKYTAQRILKDLQENQEEAFPPIELSFVPLSISLWYRAPIFLLPLSSTLSSSLKISTDSLIKFSS